MSFIKSGSVRWTAGFLISISVFLSGNAGKEISYGTGSWDPDIFGNHRAVVRVSEKADAALVRIPWRRRDMNPEKKLIIVVDAGTGARLENVCPLTVNREFGEIVFQPQTVPGDYYFYFMPYNPTGRSNYPKVHYQEPKTTADPSWLGRHGLKPYSPLPVKNAIGGAVTMEIQSVDEFNSFYPMEVIATAAETKDLVDRNPKSSYLLFPEDRTRSIRLTGDLPRLWIKSGPKSRFEGTACRGEYYPFQIGLFACRASLEDVEVSFTGMKASTGGSSIPASAMTCFNVRGVNWDGREFKKTLAVAQNKIQALWCGIQVPENVEAGTYEGDVSVKPKGLEPQKILISLTVKNDVLKDAGDSELWRMSRLRWLDSRLAFDDETVVPPFTPLSIKNGETISCLGRSLTLGADGLPGVIKSFFSAEVTAILEDGRDVLAAPVRLVVVSKDGSIVPLKGRGVRIVERKPGAVVWEAESSGGPFTLRVRGRMEFDGFVEFKTELSSSSGADVSDARLEIPVLKDAARYMMGLGFKGGFRPANYEWTWDQKKNQDALWIGDVNAGFQVSWRDENYSRPLNTNFYLSKPLNLPPSWSNEGRGGVAVTEDGSSGVLVKAFGGPRSLRAGETLHFNFILLLTPFKTIDTAAHFRTRYFHAYKPLDEVAKTGANTINIHHANAINPYINYPFLRTADMKAYIDDAHRRGFKVKIYNTIRELSNKAVELHALRSLGDEIFSRGPGGGFSWLQEHLVSGYIPAWFVPELKDAAVINSGMSRWHNYYVEGLNWLKKNVGIDGLYIDDVAFDRTTMKRVRKVLDAGRTGALIDLHSANQYNPRDGFVSSAGLYLEHFPFIDRLWFGEYFDYNSAPDYWLIEISGIPFGLMGEMLQDGGNPWRGMIYGMTNRLPWSGNDPSRLWKVWDAFGIAESRMFGFWSPRCPVRTGREDVLATAYVAGGRTLVALASWAKESARVKLSVDWKTLGLDPSQAKLEAPAVRDFQEGKTFGLNDEIPVEPGKGWMLVIK